MNRENMLKVADAIEKESATGELNMNNWLAFSDRMDATTVADFLANGDWCGTTCCIGGTATLVEMREELAVKAENDPGILDRYMYLARDDFTQECRFDVEGKAARYLGLSVNQAHDLFYAGRLAKDEFGNETGTAFAHINKMRHLVPDALRWMAREGVVDWAKGLAVAECVQRQKQGEPA